jgi:hypothetical protein
VRQPWWMPLRSHGCRRAIQDDEGQYFGRGTVAPIALRSEIAGRAGICTRLARAASASAPVLGRVSSTWIHTAAQQIGGKQERDGGILLISTLFGRFPFLRKLFADGGYQGLQFAQAIASVFPQLDVEIVKRSDAAGGFKVLPRRWVVERTIAWLDPTHATKAL